MPFSPYTPRDLAALRDTLLRWRGVHAETSGLVGYGRYRAQEYPARFAALAGQLAARIRDTATVRAAAKALAADRTPGPARWLNWRWGSRDEERLLLADLFRGDA